MSQDPIAAIASSGADASALMQRRQDASQADALRTLDQLTQTPASGGATVQLHAAELEAPPPSALNLRSLAGQFSEGLQHGFYAQDMNHLMTRLVQSESPGSGVTMGEVMTELLNVQAKVGIADAFSKVSSKLSEGLQTMVVKQG
jgi:hypothetical protein